LVFLSIAKGEEETVVNSKVVAFFVLVLLLSAALIRPPTSAHAYFYTCSEDENIVYAFSNGTTDIAGSEEQQAVKNGLRLWEDVADVHFVPWTGFTGVDTWVKWATGAHGDTKSFDGLGNVAAHTYEPCASSFGGEIHFDDAEEWTTAPFNGFEQPVDLMAVAAHEAGHALGLNHSKDESALMFEGQSTRRFLSWDDIFGVQWIYGRDNGVFHLKNKLTGGNPSSSFTFQNFNDRPVAGDWNNDGMDTIGIWRSSNGNFILRDGNPFGTNYQFQYGKSGDLPVVGDWDGDGDTTVGIYRASNASFYLENTLTSSSSEWLFSFGAAGDIPVGGDWNGDGIDSVGVFRPSNSTFYLRNEKSAGAPDATISFGASGDLPVVGDWDNDGDDTIGVYRPSQGFFYLRNSNSAGAADLSLNFGISLLGQVVTKALPIAGDWDANGSVTFGLYQN
jgi:hypothetical protein